MAFSHVASARQFRLTLNGAYAFVEYVLEGNNVYNLITTEVPEGYRGQGIAQKIAHKTFGYIIKQNGKIVLSCEFLKSFYQLNREVYESYVIN